MHLISFLGEAIVGSLNWDAREIAEEVFSGNASIDQFHIFQISNFKEKQALISFKFPVFHCSSEGFSQSLIVSIVIFAIRSICAMGANAKYTIALGAFITSTKAHGPMDIGHLGSLER